MFGIAELILFLGTAIGGINLAYLFSSFGMLARELGCFLAADITYFVLTLLPIYSTEKKAVNFSLGGTFWQDMLWLGLWAFFGCLIGGLIGGFIGGAGDIAAGIGGGLGAILAFKRDVL